MNPLWALPVAVLLAGVVVIFHVLRDARDAASELHSQLLQLGQVQVAVARVRTEAAGTRDRVEALRSR